MHINSEQSEKTSNFGMFSVFMCNITCSKISFHARTFSGKIFCLNKILFKRLFKILNNFLKKLEECI